MTGVEAIGCGYDVPSDFTRGFINHRIVTHWPFTKTHQILGWVVCFAALAFLFGSVWQARRLKNPLNP